MSDGAFGVSSLLGYAPSAFARTPELTALASVAATHGGIYATHMRHYGKEVFESLNEVFTIARDETLEQNSYDARIGSQYVAAEIVGLAELDYEAHDGRPATTINLPFICLHGGEGSDALYVGIVTAG